jgi:hypothetical protein
MVKRRNVVLSDRVFSLRCRLTPPKRERFVSKVRFAPFSGVMVISKSSNPGGRSTKDDPYGNLVFAISYDHPVALGDFGRIGSSRHHGGSNRPEDLLKGCPLFDHTPCFLPLRSELRELVFDPE